MGSNLELTSRDERERESGRERNTQTHTQTWCLEEAFDGKGLNEVVKDKRAVVVTALNVSGAVAATTLAVVAAV